MYHIVIGQEYKDYILRVMQHIKLPCWGGGDISAFLILTIGPMTPSSPCSPISPIGPWLPCMTWHDKCIHCTIIIMGKCTWFPLIPFIPSAPGRPCSPFSPGGPCIQQVTNTQVRSYISGDNMNHTMSLTMSLTNLIINTRLTIIPLSPWSPGGPWSPGEPCYMLQTDTRLVHV